MFLIVKVKESIHVKAVIDPRSDIAGTKLRNVSTKLKNWNVLGVPYIAGKTTDYHLNKILNGGDVLLLDGTQRSKIDAQTRFAFFTELEDDLFCTHGLQLIVS